MQHRIRAIAGLAAIVALSACGRDGQPVSDELGRDLNLAAGASVELAPQRAGTQVVSAIEQLPTAKRSSGTPQLVARAPQPKRAASPTREPVPAPTVAESPVTAPEPSPVAASEPVDVVREPGPVMRPAPAPQEGKRVYRSVSDVIRNSPFPINP